MIAFVLNNTSTRSLLTSTGTAGDGAWQDDHQGSVVTEEHLCTSIAFGGEAKTAEEMSF